jgi:hypothetical protein
MLRKGYLNRQIEALAMTLARLMGLKESGELGPYAAGLRSASRELSGLDLEMVAALTDDSLLSVLTADGELDVARCVILAALLTRQGEIHEGEGRIWSAVARYRKSLTLLTEALLHDEQLQTREFIPQVEDLLARLSDEEMPTPLLHRLFRYQEAVGNFARAEDALYALREADYAGIDDEAAIFYRHLLTLPDEALEKGGLPRAEVEEALEELA